MVHSVTAVISASYPRVVLFTAENQIRGSRNAAKKYSGFTHCEKKIYKCTCEVNRDAYRLKSNTQRESGPHDGNDKSQPYRRRC